MKFTVTFLVVSLLVFGQSRQTEAEPAADEKFIREAASGGILEVKLGDVATAQAESADVKKFGRRMIEDHNHLNQQLMAVAEKKGIAVSMELLANDEAQYKDLKALKGAEFDRAYIKHMLKDHKEDIAAFKKEAADGKDEAVKAFAAKALPVIEEHLKLAREIAKQLGISKDQ